MSRIARPGCQNGVNHTKMFVACCLLLVVVHLFFQEDGFLFDGTRLAEGAALLARLRDDRVLCEEMGERGRIKVRTGLNKARTDPNKG